MTIPFDKLTDEWMKNPEFKAEHERLAPEFELAKEVIKARIYAGLSQSELAQRMGTTQSVIARLESGRQMPSTTTLLRLAAATGTKVQIHLLAS